MNKPLSHSKHDKFHASLTLCFAMLHFIEQNKAFRRIGAEREKTSPRKPERKPPRPGGELNFCHADVPHTHTFTKPCWALGRPSPPTDQGALWSVLGPGAPPKRSSPSKWPRLWQTFREQCATIWAQKRCHNEAPISSPFFGPKKRRQSE